MRRRKSSSQGSLDSLLDTMTNVVGILVILLTVTQLGVGDAVQRIRGDIAEVSIEDLESAKQKVADTQAGIQERQKELDELNRTKPEDKQNSISTRNRRP